jgi:hypothetical protein
MRAAFNLVELHSNVVWTDIRVSENNKYLGVICFHRVHHAGNGEEREAPPGGE